MCITVRDAVGDDRETILRLIAVMARDFGEKLALDVAYVGTYLSHPGCHVLLAEDDGRVSGLLSYSLRPSLFHGADSGSIDELVVALEARGRGVATLLLQTAIARMTAAGCAEVSVSTTTDNEPAMRLYRRLGLAEESLLLERHFDREGAAEAG